MSLTIKKSTSTSKIKTLQSNVKKRNEKLGAAWGKLFCQHVPDKAPDAPVGKESLPAVWVTGLIPVGRSWRTSHSGFCLENSTGQRSLVSCSPKVTKSQTRQSY